MKLPLKIGQPRFLTTAEVLTLHELSVAGYGGTPEVLDAGKLDSALAQPKQGFAREYVHDFPFGMAAAYGYHIAMNHPFADGNKRTAFGAMVAFLHLNGWVLEVPDQEGAAIIIDMIEQRRDKAWLSELLEQRCRARVSWELRDFVLSVDFDHLNTFLRAYEACSQPERIATLTEAAESVPMLDAVLHQVILHLERGEQAAANEWFGRASMLFALYRIAEDMDYEW